MNCYVSILSDPKQFIHPIYVIIHFKYLRNISSNQGQYPFGTQLVQENIYPPCGMIVFH